MDHRYSPVVISQFRENVLLGREFALRPDNVMSLIRVHIRGALGCLLQHLQGYIDIHGRIEKENIWGFGVGQVMVGELVLLFVST